MSDTVRVSHLREHSGRSPRLVLVAHDRAGFLVKRIVGPLDYVSLTVAASITGLTRATAFRLANRGAFPVRRMRRTGCRVVRLVDAVRVARSRGVCVDLSRLTPLRRKVCRA